MSADVAGAAGGECVVDPQAHGRADRQGGDVAGGEPSGVASVCPLAANTRHSPDTDNFRSRLFLAIRVVLITIRIGVLAIGISFCIIHGTDSCSTLLLAFRGGERFKEPGNSPQATEELGNRQVDDVLERLLACEKGGHAQFEALAV